MAGSERWYFSKARLQNTPSRKCGVDADKELSYRQQAANLIQDMGQRLQVSQLCINTAIVYMHRFYIFYSFTKYHRNDIACCALFLAAKVEEQPRKLEHVIKVCHICLHRDAAPLDVKSEKYVEQAQRLVENENIMLQTLGFDIAIEHPHTFVVKCCQLVRASKDLAQTSYFMATNSLHLTTMCLQVKPTLVACVCIHLACKWSRWTIPRSSEGKDWFYYVDQSATHELLETLTSEFLAILDKCPSRLKRQILSGGGKGTAPDACFPGQANPNVKVPEKHAEKRTHSSKDMKPKPPTPVKMSTSDSTAAAGSSHTSNAPLSPMAKKVKIEQQHPLPPKPVHTKPSASESFAALPTKVEPYQAQTPLSPITKKIKTETHSTPPKPHPPAKTSAFEPPAPSSREPPPAANPSSPGVSRRIKSEPLPTPPKLVPVKMELNSLCSFGLARETLPPPPPSLAVPPLLSPLSKKLDVEPNSPPPKSSHDSSSKHKKKEKRKDKDKDRGHKHKHKNKDKDRERERSKVDREKREDSSADSFKFAVSLGKGQDEGSSKSPIKLKISKMQFNSDHSADESASKLKIVINKERLSSAS